MTYVFVAVNKGFGLYFLQVDESARQIFAIFLEFFFIILVAELRLRVCSFTFQREQLRMKWLRKKQLFLNIFFGVPHLATYISFIL